MMPVFVEATRYSLSAFVVNIVTISIAAASMFVVKKEKDESITTPNKKNVGDE
jgi:hypothetical protein